MSLTGPKWNPSFFQRPFFAQADPATASPAGGGGGVRPDIEAFHETATQLFQENFPDADGAATDDFTQRLFDKITELAQRAAGTFEAEKEAEAFIRTFQTPPQAKAAAPEPPPPSTPAPAPAPEERPEPEGLKRFQFECARVLRSLEEKYRNEVGDAFWNRLTTAYAQLVRGMEARWNPKLDPAFLSRTIGETLEVDIQKEIQSLKDKKDQVEEAAKKEAAPPATAKQPAEADRPSTGSGRTGSGNVEAPPPPPPAVTHPPKIPGTAEGLLAVIHPEGFVFGTELKLFDAEKKNIRENAARQIALVCNLRDTLDQNPGGRWTPAEIAQLREVYEPWATNILSGIFQMAQHLTGTPNGSTELISKFKETPTLDAAVVTQHLLRKWEEQKGIRKEEAPAVAKAPPAPEAPPVTAAAESPSPAPPPPEPAPAVESAPVIPALYSLRVLEKGKRVERVDCEEVPLKNNGFSATCQHPKQRKLKVRLEKKPDGKAWHVFVQDQRLRTTVPDNPENRILLVQEWRKGFKALSVSPEEMTSALARFLEAGKPPSIQVETLTEKGADIIERSDITDEWEARRLIVETPRSDTRTEFSLGNWVFEKGDSSIQNPNWATRWAVLPGTKDPVLFKSDPALFETLLHGNHFPKSPILRSIHEFLNDEATPYYSSQICTVGEWEPEIRWEGDDNGTETRIVQCKDALGSEIPFPIRRKLSVSKENLSVSDWRFAGTPLNQPIAGILNLDAGNATLLQFGDPREAEDHFRKIHQARLNSRFPKSWLRAGLKAGRRFAGQATLRPKISDAELNRRDFYSEAERQEFIQTRGTDRERVQLSLPGRPFFGVDLELFPDYLLQPFADLDLSSLRGISLLGTLLLGQEWMEGQAGFGFHPGERWEWKNNLDLSARIYFARFGRSPLLNGIDGPENKGTFAQWTVQGGLCAGWHDRSTPGLNVLGGIQLCGEINRDFTERQTVEMGKEDRSASSFMFYLQWDLELREPRPDVRVLWQEADNPAE